MLLSLLSRNGDGPVAVVISRRLRCVYHHGQPIGKELERGCRGLFYSDSPSSPRKLSKTTKRVGIGGIRQRTNREPPDYKSRVTATPFCWVTLFPKSREGRHQLLTVSCTNAMALKDVGVDGRVRFRFSRKQL